VRLSAETINRARRDGWAIYHPADSESSVFDCTVYTYGFASDGAPGLISVWDNGVAPLSGARRGEAA